ncbi:hypothetical protein [Parvularcula sp. IMCC14364]|uniref:hypothetical protein n=1 Tax=Parvularcula sp. IMCC14364 TaxID=3067902 RepID=UPI002741BBE2|nr:hypothetical protein [Parvularcula sp. IMCC14364]
MTTNQEQGEKIFQLWHELKKAVDLARAADLPETESLLRITADTLVKKYAALGLPMEADLHSLVWDETEWPAKTATYMELKSMLLRAREQEEKTPPAPVSNISKKKKSG